MKEKNLEVATVKNNETTSENTTITLDTKQNTKVPTGKVKTLAQRNKIRKEREEQYRNFRINCLKRRAKRMKLSEEETNAKIEELKKVLEGTHNYNVLLLFNRDNAKMIKEMFTNDSIECKIFTDYYAWLIADDELLKELREMLPDGTKIHPYAIRKKLSWPSSSEETKKAKKPYTKAEKKALALAAKKKRKQDKIAAHLNHKEHAKQRKEEHNKQARKLAKAKMLFEKRARKASKKKGGTVVHMTSKKASNAKKKASTNVKKAA